MKVALAWIDPGDPTDRAIASGLAPRLRAQGHEVVIVGPKRGQDSARGALDGVPAYYFGDGADPRRVVEFSRHTGIDVWHCHVFARPHRLLLRALRHVSTPLLASLHLVLPDYVRAAGGKSALGRLLHRAQHVTAVSPASLDVARGLFPDLIGKSSVVTNGIVPAKPDGRVKRPDGPFILCAARLAPYKGLDILLMALARLREIGCVPRLLLCGRDQMRGGLRRFARTLGLSDQVSFLGPVSAPKLRALMDASRFVVLPSRQENMPLVLLEALSAGKAVVATRVGGVPDIIRRGRTGLLVEPGDVESLAQSMRRLWVDRGLRRDLERGARACSRAFSWDGPASQYEGLYARQ